MDSAALKASWAAVSRHGDAVPGFFYARLFTAQPYLRELFPISMATQRDRLVSALGRIVSGVDEIEAVVPFVQQLGRDHRRFDIKPDHFPMVGEALLATLGYFLGPAWTPQLAADWTAAYEIVATAMVDAAEADDNPAYWTATVLDHERRGLDVAVVRLQIDLPYGYRAGQYCAVEVPSRPRLWRYYSLANAPRRDGTAELHVKAVPGGQVSTAMVAGLTVGDSVKLGPPLGDALAVDPYATRPMVLIAGGTGLAPMKALVEQVAADGGQRAVTLFVGARTQSDLYDLPDLTEGARQWPWLTVVPVLSDDPGFPGEQGPAVDAAIRHGLPEHDIYLCGPAGMIHSGRDRLRAAGVAAERIRYEGDTYGPYQPADDITDLQEAMSR